MTELTVQQRVQNGIEWLDKYGPADWRDRIDLSQLDLRSGCDCVLGQAFVDLAVPASGLTPYFYATDKYRTQLRDSPDLFGFHCGDIMRKRSIDEEYNALTAEWKKRLTAMKEPANA